MKKLMLVLVAVLLVAASAQAVMVENVTSDTVIFFDDFESASVVDPLGYTSSPTDADPDGASPGTWTVLNETETGSVQVTDYDSLAAEGSNYLRLHRTTPAWFQSQLNVAEQTNTGDAIHFETMIMVNDTGVPAFQFFKGKDSGGTEQTLAYTKFEGFSDNIVTGTGVDTGLDYVADEWKKLEFDWLVGADTFTITYDGTTSAALDVGNTDVVSFTAVALGMHSISGSASYYDAIPEPVPVGGFGKTATAPTIDGAYDSTWANAKVYSDFYTVDGSAPSDTEDLRVRYCGMWDDANLYILAEVTDNPLLNRDSGNTFYWFDDSIEIYTDVHNKDDQYSAGDIYQSTCVIELGGSNPLTITPFGTPAPGTYRMVVNADSYVLEASIPWATLGTSFTPAFGSIIGFGIGVNDADEAGDVRDTQSMWATSSNRLWENSKYFPTVELVETAPAQTTCTEQWDNGFGSPYDFNKDCIVDVEDLADFVASWLDCTIPADPACN